MSEEISLVLSIIVPVVLTALTNLAIAVINRQKTRKELANLDADRELKEADADLKRAEYTTMVLEPLRDTIEQLERKQIANEVRIAEQGAKIEMLERENRSLRYQLAMIEGENAALKKENIVLKERIISLEDKEEKRNGNSTTGH